MTKQQKIDNAQHKLNKQKEETGTGTASCTKLEKECSKANTNCLEIMWHGCNQILSYTWGTGNSWTRNCVGKAENIVEQSISNKRKKTTNDFFE